MPALTNIIGVSPLGVVANVLDSGIVISVFELQQGYYNHFRP